MSLFDMFDKRKKKIEKHLKAYQELNDKLNEIDSSFDTIEKGTSFKDAQDITENQKKYVINSMKEIAIGIDALMASYDAEELKKDYYALYFNKMPRYSEFNGSSKHITEESEIMHFHDHSKMEEGKEFEYLTKLIVEKSGLKLMEQYISFLAEQGVKTPPMFNKLKQVKMVYVEELETAIQVFYYKTVALMNREHLYENIPMTYNAETIMLHKYIRLLIDNELISKYKPFKVAVKNVPDCFASHSETLGIMDIDHEEREEKKRMNEEENVSGIRHKKGFGMVEII